MAMEEVVRSANRIGELVAQARVGPLLLSLLPAGEPGDVDRVVLLAPHLGRWRAVGLVSHQMATMAGSRDGRSAWIGLESDAPPESAAAAIVQHVNAGGLDFPRVNALDVALILLEALKTSLSVQRGRWRLEAWTGEKPESGGNSLSLAGPEEVRWENLIQILQNPDGATVSLPRDEMGQGISDHRFADPESLIHSLPDLIDRVRRALGARDSYRRRPFSIERAGALLLDALRGSAERPLSLKLIPDSFPVRHPSGWLSREGGNGPHVSVRLAESNDGLTLSAGRFQRTFRAFEEFTAALPEIRNAVAEEDRRLTPDKLQPGRIYRVVRSFAGLAVGTGLRFSRFENIPRDGFVIYHFTSEPAGGTLALSDFNDRDLETLRALDEHLA